jgi:hypothetical protein
MKKAVLLLSLTVWCGSAAFAQTPPPSPTSPTSPVFGPPYNPANPYGYNPNAGVSPFSPYVIGGVGGPTMGGLSPNGFLALSPGSMGSQTGGGGAVGSSSAAGIFGLLGPASLNPFSIFAAPTLLNPFSLFGNPYTAPTVTVPTPTTTPSQTPPTTTGTPPTMSTTSGR